MINVNKIYNESQVNYQVSFIKTLIISGITVILLSLKWVKKRNFCNLNRGQKIELDKLKYA